MTGGIRRALGLLILAVVAGLVGVVASVVGLPGVGLPLLVVAGLVLLSALTYMGATLLRTDVHKAARRRAASRPFFIAAGTFFFIFGAYAVAFYADAEIAHPEYGSKTALDATWAFGSLLGLVGNGAVGLWRFMDEANEKSDLRLSNQPASQD